MFAYIFIFRIVVIIIIWLFTFARTINVHLLLLYFGLLSFLNYTSAQSGYGTFSKSARTVRLSRSEETFSRQLH